MRGPICKFCLTLFALVALGIVVPARSQSTRPTLRHVTPADRTAGASAQSQRGGPNELS